MDLPLKIDTTRSIVDQRRDVTRQLGIFCENEHLRINHVTLLAMQEFLIRRGYLMPDGTVANAYDENGGLLM